MADEGLGNAAERFAKSLQSAFPGQTSLGANAARNNTVAGAADTMDLELQQLEVELGPQTLLSAALGESGFSWMQPCGADCLSE